MPRHVRKSSFGNLLFHILTYDMIITNRKKVKDANKPEERYIGFATIKTSKYAKRWGVETAYAKIEECRAKTRIRDLRSRMLCFYYSLILFNEWIMPERCSLMALKDRVP